MWFILCLCRQCFHVISNYSQYNRLSLHNHVNTLIKWQTVLFAGAFAHMKFSIDYIINTRLWYHWLLSINSHCGYKINKTPTTEIHLRNQNLIDDHSGCQTPFLQQSFSRLGLCWFALLLKLKSQERHVLSKALREKMALHLSC